MRRGIDRSVGRLAGELTKSNQRRQADSGVRVG